MDQGIAPSQNPPEPLLDRAYREAISLVSDAVLVADAAGRCVDANESALHLLRYDRSELVGLRAEDLLIYREDDAPGRYAAFGLTGTWDGVADLRCGDGSVIRMHGRIRTVQQGGEAQIGIAVLRPADPDVGTARSVDAAERVQVLLQMTTALSAARTPEAVASVVLRETLRVVGGVAGVAAVASTETVEVVACEGISAIDDGRWQRFPLDASLPLSDAIRERRTLVLETLAERDERYPELVGVGYGFDHAIVSIPMLTGGRAVGGLTVSFAGPRAFSEDELGFLASIAALGALALERARLRASEQTQRERAAFLAASGEILSESLDYERTLAEVARLVVHGVVVDGEKLAGRADWCAVDLLQEDGSIRLIAVEHRDRAKIELAHELRRRVPPGLQDPTGVGAVMRSGEPELTAEISDQLIEAAVEDPEVRRILLDLGLTSAMIVPLVERGRVLGAMTLVASESGRRFGAEGVALAEDIARRAANAIDNARLYRERDHIATTLQQVLLPGSLPEVPGFDCAASYTPGRSGMEVGGDFYDVFQRPGGSLGIVVGDVSGKGPEAAAIMGLARQSVRVIGMSTDRPSEILGALNRALALTEHGDRFVTVCDVRLRPDEHGATATSCCGGHPLPILLRRHGEVTTLGHPGQLLGVFDDVELRDATTHLDPGDALVLYTDGVTEWGPGSDRTEEFLDVLRGAAGRTAAQIVERVERWRQEGIGTSATDDAALLVVRCVGSG